ncbi:MAG: acetate--CoA ligase family protein [Paracraurococcus sp.]
MNPRAIAVIGASDDAGKFGGRVIHYLIKHGFPGTLLPINPVRATIRGLPAYPSIAAAPGPTDVAVLAVPAAVLLREIEACAAAGVGACVVITGKLADAGEAGAALEAEVTAVARAAGMRLVGPNCLGLFNVTDAAMLSSSLALEVERVKPGGIGMVSQSGALMGALVSLGHRHGAGFSRCVSVGNQADLELCDFLQFLIEDPATRVITLYVEGLKDAARFGPLLRRARAAGKPVLCVKAGRSEAGAQAARSHTASLAGSHAAFAALCRDAGAVLLDDPAAMVLAADVLDRLGGLPRAGMGVAVVASSGGSTVTTTDMLAAYGLRTAAIADATRAEMARWMPASHVHLPLDTGSFHDNTSEDALRGCLRAFMADDDVGAVLVPMTTQPAMARRAAMLPPLAREGTRPLLYVMMAGEVGDAAREAMREADFPYFDQVAQALAVLRALEAEAEGRDRAALVPPTRPAGMALPAALPMGALLEAEAKRLAAAYGIPVTREIFAATGDAAVAAAEAIGFPVVLKGVSRAVVHKSDIGLVKLSLRDAAAVRAAHGELLAAPVPLEGVLVQEMARGEAELILGARHEPGLGAFVLVGTGGVLVEVLRDVQLAPAPLRPEDARAMLQRLALWPVLQGVRGRPPLDVDAAVDALVRLSWLAADLGERLVEMDLNPILLRAAGEGCIAVDARATLR